METAAPQAAAVPESDAVQTEASTQEESVRSEIPELEQPKETAALQAAAVPKSDAVHTEESTQEDSVRSEIPERKQSAAAECVPDATACSAFPECGRQSEAAAGRAVSAQTESFAEASAAPEKTPAKRTASRSSRKRGAPGFDEFWAAYPRKAAKQVARSAWDRIAPDDALRREILDALGKQKLCDQWIRESGRFIPYPATWLNGGRWEDETVTPPVTPPVRRVSAQEYTQRDYRGAEESADEMMERLCGRVS